MIRFTFMIRFTLVCLSALALSSLEASSADADLILHNGKIVTVDSRFSVQQAIAISGGKIAAVGSNAAVLKTRGPTTQTVDLAGKTVLPGLKIGRASCRERV